MIARLLACAAIVAGVGLGATPALATESGHTTVKPICATWTMRGATGAYPDVTFGGPPQGSAVGKNLARLVKPTTGEQPGVEFATKALGVDDTTTAREVSVKFVLSPTAKADAGAVRLFGYKASNANTLTDGPDFKDVATSTSGVLKFTLPAGTKLGTLGLVYDASNDGKGSVTFVDLKVGDALVQFTRCVKPPIVLPCTQYVYQGTRVNLCKEFPGLRDRDCTDIKRAVTVIGRDVWRLDKDHDKTACEIPATTPPTTPPTTAPTTPPTTAPTTTPAEGSGGDAGAGNGSGPSLPVTGPAGFVLAGLGASVILGGGVLFLLGRRRKNSPTFEA
jgi:hypothetical protein